MLAIPVFAFTAYYVARVWSTEVLRASVMILGSAIIAAGVLEPAWEYFLAGAPFEWAFGAVRNRALAAFVGVGLITYITTLALYRRVGLSSNQRFIPPR